MEALKDGLTAAVRSIDKWEERAEGWAAADAARVQQLYECDVKLNEAWRACHEVVGQYERAHASWQQERSGLLDRLGEHEENIERASQ